MHVALFSEDGTVEHTVARTAGGAEGMPALSIDELGEGVAFGTLVSHAHYARDVEDRLGCFFCFPDIRVRYPGRFRLRFQVFELPNPAHEGAESTALTHILSEPFRVYGSKDFPGVDSSTRLTRVLSSQIVGIPVHNKSRLKYEDDNAEQDD
ncbi:hypothetical protein GGF46_001043 [Coemansia sp. RSA 552]|nr:hypothetical protein GGF46_001043 [Coemansia sp. RSA 552]